MDGVIKVTEYAQVPDVVALLGLTVVDANAVALRRRQNWTFHARRLDEVLTLVSRWQPSAPPPGGQLMRFCGLVGSVTSASSSVAFLAAARPLRKARTMAVEKRILLTVEVNW